MSDSIRPRERRIPLHLHFRVFDCVQALAQLDLRTFCVPIENCKCAPLGPVSPQFVKVLEIMGFDQAPVADHNAEILGLVVTTDLRRLAGAHGVLQRDPEMISNQRLVSPCSVDALLQTLVQSHAVLVEHAGNVFGLMTVSDLNRHAFRAALYPIFPELEAFLADLIDYNYQVNHWEWIEKLPSEKQVRIVGNWELARRKGIDTGPVSACTLTELLSVTKGDAALRKAYFPFPAAKLGHVIFHICDMRNRVMHPVRHLVLNSEDIEQLRRTLIDVKEIAVAVRTRLSAS